MIFALGNTSRTRWTAGRVKSTSPIDLRRISRMFCLVSMRNPLCGQTKAPQCWGASWPQREIKPVKEAGKIFARRAWAPSPIGWEGRGEGRFGGIYLTLWVATLPRRATSRLKRFSSCAAPRKHDEPRCVRQAAATSAPQAPPAHWTSVAADGARTSQSATSYSRTTGLRIGRKSAFERCCGQESPRSAICARLH